MLRHIAWFETRYWLRSWMMWVFLALVSALVLANVSAGDVLAVDNSYNNAPYNIQDTYAWVSLLTLLMTTAFANSAAGREFGCGFWQILFTTPLRKFDFLVGRFLGSTLIAVVPMLGTSLAILLGKWMPWAKPEGWGPVYWGAHLKAILVFAIPNTLFIAAIIFAIAVLTRSTLTSFLGALLLLAGYGLARTLASDLSHQTAAMLLDPFGIRTFELVTKYWTAADKNHLSVGLTGMLLWNRLIWLSVGAAVFTFACSRFRFEERNERPSKAALAEQDDAARDAIPADPSTRARPRTGAAARLAQFWGSLQIEFRGLVKATSFLVILAAALLAAILVLVSSATEGYGDTSLPVTYTMMENTQSLLLLFLIVLIAHYAGALVWKDRDTGMDEIHDASPHPVWPDYAAKIGALLGAILIIQFAGMAAGILFQAFHGYHRYQLGLYAFHLLVMRFPDYLFWAVLAFFIQILSPNKYVGHFAFVVLFIVNLFVWTPLHISTFMVQFDGTPDYTYSDLFGYGPYLQGQLWFRLYWLTFCSLLALGTILLWQRGRETGWRYRLHNSRLRFTPAFGSIAAGCALAFLAVGTWVFYNTKILNHIITDDENQTNAADYEKTYKRFQHLAQPTLKSVSYEVDLRPDVREMTMRGDQVLQNETSSPISEIHLTLVGGDGQTDTELDGASLVSDDRRLRYRIYRLASPMQPGESRHLRFTARLRKPGFENQVGNLGIVQNGSFFTNAWAPSIGYQPSAELPDRDVRKKKGLPEKDPMPVLERNCLEHCSEGGSRWVSAESVISTAPDQIAIGPGSLVREWTENGRRFFQYKLDHDSLNSYSFVSGRYEVAREEWNGVKLEVYYHKDHPWNVPKMLRSMRRSLEYYTANFGPYPNKEARIIEFPRIRRFAQAFPGTMPYSEGVGFIADLEHPDAIDFVYFVVAHEMAHQWWYHQVVGADMQGAQMLSETLAEYSALMVMEKEYGRDAMRRFLDYEMDRYLTGRSGELHQELPLERVEGQAYVYYQKGGVAMYYLKEMIGEDAMNRALRNVLHRYGYAPPPYPTSYALVDALEAETPESLRYLIKDLFEDITLFSNRTLSATAKERPDGKYEVTIDVQAKKSKADGKGNEKEARLDDWIEIGAFAKPAPGQKYGKILYRQRVPMTQPRGVYTFTVDELPDLAGIDPMLLLVDRIPDDNLKKVEVGN